MPRTPKEEAADIDDSDTSGPRPPSPLLVTSSGALPPDDGGAQPMALLGGPWYSRSSLRRRLHVSEEIVPSGFTPPLLSACLRLLAVRTALKYSERRVWHLVRWQYLTFLRPSDKASPDLPADNAPGADRHLNCSLSAQSRSRPLAAISALQWAPVGEIQKFFPASHHVTPRRLTGWSHPSKGREVDAYFRGLLDCCRLGRVSDCRQAGSDWELGCDRARLASMI